MGMPARSQRLYRFSWQHNSHPGPHFPQPRSIPHTQDTQDDANGADIQSKSKRKSVNYLWDKKGSVKNMTNKFETGG